MKSGMRITSTLPKCLLLALALTLAPAALASNIWYVDGVNGNDTNDCLSSQTACQTIGHAIALCSSGDSIMVAPAIYTENLKIKRSLKIIGSDATTTIVDGNQAGSVVTITYNKAHVRLSKLTIRNGSARQGEGGGINSGGATLTIKKSIISGNYADFGGGGISCGEWGTVTIDNSTISTNRAGDYAEGGGGILCRYGALTITRSTIRGNSSASGGGGIEQAYGTATITNSTISGNTASRYGGGGIIVVQQANLMINSSTIYGNAANDGSGIRVGFITQVTLQNTIIANQGTNCSFFDGGTTVSNGYNLSNDDSCNLTGPGDMNNTDPKLGKLKNYGGPTKTMMLLPGSPAIDAGNPNGCTDDKGNLLKTDQRGWARPGKYDTGSCDIGAFERQHD